MSIRVLISHERTKNNERYHLSCPGSVSCCSPQDRLLRASRQGRRAVEDIPTGECSSDTYAESLKLRKEERHELFPKNTDGFKESAH
jgi:hypothetical protein